MAEIVEGPGTWSAVVRCAHPVQYPEPRVDGCFSLIRITMDDLRLKDDGDGHYWMETNCPSCGQTIFPKWQIGDGPLKVLLRDKRR